MVGVALPSPSLRLLTKSLPVLCLAAWVGSRAVGPWGRWLAVGLVLSAAGDLWLERDRFLPGLGAFLLAHVAYALGFSAASRRPALFRALPFALYGAGLYLFLWPPGPLAVPVLAYTVAICLMMWRAAARIGDPGDACFAASLGLAGALLFAASDTLIALDRFHGSITGARYPIILLYWLGQLGIAGSAVARRGDRVPEDRDQDGDGRQTPEL
jgi:uncharacterized membrane protein YhhN